MKQVPSSEQLLRGLVLPALLALVACKAEARAGAGEPGAKPRGFATAPPKPAPPVLMPDAIPQGEVPSHGHALPASVTVKYSGKLGERLEGDTYYFKLRGLKLCHVSGKVAGVEVEIEAKERLSVSPRDVVIGKGGITFNASLDFQRKLPGCTPLLQISALRKGQAVRGFVLFDLPSPPGDDLRLIYQPTRWGGAGYVTAALSDWSAPP